MTGAGTNYCGCCGRPTRNTWWCHRCMAHLTPDDRSPWDRTWFAQHGEPCPFEPKVRARKAHLRDLDLEANRG